MNTKINILLKFTVVLFLITTTLFAKTVPSNSEILEISKGVTTQKYPDANTVLLYDLQKAKYNADGTASSVDDFFIKILTEVGRNENRELSFQFNVHYEKIYIPLLEIIHANGKVTPIDVAKNSRISTESSQVGSNIFDPDHKKLLITIPNLSIGDIIHIKYIDNLIKPRIANQWGGFYVLQSNDPILYYEVIVDAPKERPLKSIVIKDEIKNSVKFNKVVTGDRIIYKWIAKDVPQIFPEPNMPPLYMCAQRLLLSTAKNWQEISQWYYELCRPRLNSVTDEIKAKVHELINGANSDEEKIKRLFQFVSQKIRYVGITAESEAPGYEPHNVSETFEQRHGVCRDKMALLVSMLELAGIKAYPVLFYAGVPKDDEVPNMYFNHAVTAVETAPNKYMLMDPTYETTTELLPSTLSNMSYLVATPKGDTLRRSEVVPSKDNLLKISTFAEVDENGKLTGSTRLDFIGVNDQMYRQAFSVWSESLQKEFFAGQLKKILPGAKLQDVTISPSNIRDMNIPLKIILNYQLDDYINNSNKEFLLNLPIFSKKFGANSFVLGSLGLKERKYAINLFSTCSVDETLSLKLPTTVNIVSMPKSGEIKLDKVASWKRVVEFNDTSNTITNKIYMSIDTVDLKPQEYLKLKSAIKTISNNEKYLPIAIKNLLTSTRNKDSVILNLHSNIFVNSSSEWSKTTKIRRKLISYGGIKNYGEQQFTYNPELQSISISGKVISPDGKTTPLEDKDMILLDAPITANAPNYPSWKTLVVSFPGVVENSILDYEVKTKYFKQPFFSTYYTFNNSEIIMSNKFTLNIPKDFKLNISEIPFEVSSLKKEENNRIIYQWAMEKVSEIPQEILQAPYWSFAPTIFVAGGNYISYAKMLNEKLQSSIKISPELKELTQKVTLSEKNDIKKIELIRQWIAKNIRPINIGISEHPLNNFTSPNVTIKNGYANSQDIAILAASMLKAINVKFEILLPINVPADSILDEKIQNIAQNNFNNVIIYIPKYKIYLDTSNQYSYLNCSSLQYQTALELKSGKFTKILPAKEFLTSESRFFNIKLLPDMSAEVSMKIILSGDKFAEYNRMFSEFTPEKFKQFSQELTNSISPNAELISELKFNNKSYPATLEGKFKINDFAIKDKNYIQFSLIDFTNYASAIRVTSEERKTPMLRNSAVAISLNYDIELPKNYQVIRSAINNSFTKEYKENIEISENKLKIKSSLNLSAKMISQDEYTNLLKLAKILSSKESNTIILKEKK